MLEIRSWGGEPSGRFSFFYFSSGRQLIFLFWEISLEWREIYSLLFFLYLIYVELRRDASCCITIYK